MVSVPVGSMFCACWKLRRRGLRVPTPVHIARAVALLSQSLLNLPHARRADEDLRALPLRLILRRALVADGRLLGLRVTAAQRGENSGCEEDLPQCHERLLSMT